MKASPVLIALSLLMSPGAFAQHCCGDCNADGTVTIDEILTTVGNAMDGCDSGACCGDCDGNGGVQVDEIIQAASCALTACGRNSVCGGPLSSTPQLCHFRAVTNPIETPGLLAFTWDWSDAENDINLFCVGLQQIGYDAAPQTECTTEWTFPLPTRANGQDIIYVRSPWLPMTITGTSPGPLNGPTVTSNKIAGSTPSRTVLVLLQVGDVGGHMSNLIQTQLQLIR